MRVTPRGVVCVTGLTALVFAGICTAAKPAPVNTAPVVPVLIKAATPTAVPTATLVPKPTSTPFNKTADGITKLHVKNGGGIWLATSNAAWDALMKASAVNDELGIEILIQRGQVIVVPDNTRVTILDRAFTSTQVRILEGEYRGVAGWTLKEYIYNDPLVK